LHFQSQGDLSPLATRASTTASDHSSHGPYALLFFLRAWLWLELLMQIDLFNVNNVYPNVIRVTQNVLRRETGGQVPAQEFVLGSERPSKLCLPSAGRVQMRARRVATPHRLWPLWPARTRGTIFGRFSRFVPGLCKSKMLER
jgi:hypothetical protein